MSEKIPLLYPVTVAGREYKELTMRRAKVKDRRVASRQATEDAKEISLIANLCDVPPDVIDELDAADFAKVQEVLKGFFGLSTPT